MHHLTPTKSLRPLAVALLAAAGFVLTACGSGDHNDPETAGGQPSVVTTMATTSQATTSRSAAPPESTAVPCVSSASEMMTLVGTEQLAAAGLTEWQRVITVGCPQREADLDTAVAEWNRQQAARQAQQAAAEQAAADAAAQQSAAQEAAAQSAAVAAASQSVQEDLYETGWYDERGWVSPQSAQRAKEAGIPAGDLVPNYLRCGTICGESPTSGEVQSQWLEEQGLVNTDGSLVDDPCTSGYPMGGTCYPDYDAAAAACGGYLIRGNCYPSGEAARAAGEGE